MLIVYHKSSFLYRIRSVKFLFLKMLFVPSVITTVVWSLYKHGLVPVVCLHKKGIDKLTFYRYPLNYLVHWMIPLSLNLFFIQFSFLFQQFLNHSILFFSFSLIYLSFKNHFFLIILSRHITKPNPVFKYV